MNRIADPGTTRDHLPNTWEPRALAFAARLVAARTLTILWTPRKPARTPADAHRLNRPGVSGDSDRLGRLELWQEIL